SQRKRFMSHTVFSTWLSVPLLALGLLGATASVAANGLTQPHVQVRGAANVEVAPDALRMTVRINELSQDVSTAKTTIEARTRQFVEALKKLGVAGRDITTQPLSIQQDYDYSKSPRELLGVNVSRT